MSDLDILQHLYPEEVILASEYHAMDTYWMKLNIDK